MKRKLFGILFVLSIVAACLPTGENNQPTAALSFTPTSTYTPDPSPTETKLPASPTITSIPTLLPDEKMKEVENLQKTNGNCQWPCWWGITPGMTTWPEANDFIQPLSIGITSVTKNGYKVYLAAFPMRDGSRLLVDFYVHPQDNIVDVIYLGQELTMDKFLGLEGKPDEIWFFAEGEVPAGSPFIKVILFYPSKGILTSYWGESRSVKRHGSNYLTVCANEFYPFGPVWFFAPNAKGSLNDLPLNDLSTGFSASDNYGFKRLETYTNMNAEDFYNGVLSSLQSTCLETQVEIWPNPDLYVTPKP